MACKLRITDRHDRELIRGLEGIVSKLNSITDKIQQKPPPDARSVGLLLDEVKDLMKQTGFELVNVDCMLQAEEPNLKEYKPAMRNLIARRLGISDEVVNIKATTMEGLGAIGDRQGIAAFVTVMLRKD